MNDFDVVIPNSNEDGFIATAISLGYKEIVFLSDNINYKKISSNTIIVKTAYLLKNANELQKARTRFDYIFANAERKYFELKADYIIGAELSDRKDSFHYRNTSLNQVHAELAKDNDIAIVFGFSSLIHTPALVLGRMKQNAVLVKKYKLRHAAFSLARRPDEMRSRNILDALLSILHL
jgi:hypothetical protein